MVNSRIIVYSSNTGYTRQYAKLLGKALDMPKLRAGQRAGMSRRRGGR